MFMEEVAADLPPQKKKKSRGEKVKNLLAVIGPVICQHEYYVRGNG